MKTIEKYIQFAIKNGLDESKDFNILDNVGMTIAGGNIGMCGCVVYFNREGYGSYCYPLEKIITSKEFIEAIARGLNSNSGLGKIFNTRVSNVTKQQAIAIRDNRLEDFITNLHIGN